MTDKPENKNDGQPASSAGDFADILSRMRAARSSFLAGELTDKEYIDRTIELDRRLTFNLSGNFNAQSGFLVTQPEGTQYASYRASLSAGQGSALPAHGAETEIIERLQGQSGKPRSFFSPEQEIAARQEMFSRLLRSHPQLASMTLRDAADMVVKTTAGEEVEWKYGDADPSVVMCAALTMINIHRDELQTVNPSLHRSLSASDPDYIRTVVSGRILGSASEDGEFVAWETEKRAQVIAAIRADKTLMADIGKVKPLLDTGSQEEFLAQHRLRDSISQRVLDIYARAYDAPELLRADILTTTYAPVETMNENDIYGYAGGVAGLNNEDYVFVRTTLYNELLLRDPMDTPREVGEKFLLTLNEESRHAVDNIYSDRLVNGKLDADHPAFRHTNLIFLNNYNYIPDGDSYASQYAERTAKEAAAEITNPIAGDIFPPAPEPARPEGQVMVLEGMTIRGDVKP